MNPKEKAEELLRIFYNQMGMPLDCEWNDDCYNKFKDRNGLAKTCALIAVDEIIKSRPFSPQATENQTQGLCETVMYPFKFWQEVKQEIKKL
jgi:hypothetical protein